MEMYVSKGSTKAILRFLLCVFCFIEDLEASIGRDNLS